MLFFGMLVVGLVRKCGILVLFRVSGPVFGVIMIPRCPRGDRSSEGRQEAVCRENVRVTAICGCFEMIRCSFSECLW
jgi:hypothetical protein